MKEQEKDFMQMAKVVEHYLKKYGNPHTTIIANQLGIEVLNGEKAQQFELED